MEDVKNPVEAKADTSLAERAFRALFAVTLVGCVCAILLKALARFDVRSLWDDAYIFQRYAHNVLREGKVAWNPGGAPTYGLTSPAFLVVGVPLLAVTRGNMSLAALLSSALPGLVLMGLLARLAQKAAGGGTRGRAAIALVFVCLAISTFADHFVSGMDTTFGLGCTATYLLVAHELSSRLADPTPPRRLGVILGVLGGFSLAVRPEMATLAVLVPLSLVAFPKTPVERRMGLTVLGVTVLGLGAHLLFCRLYFGTPLPLPFWAKGTDLYGAGIARAYRGGTTHDLLVWLGFFWPLFIVTIVAVTASLRSFLRDTPAMDKGVLVGALFLIGYSWIVVTPIMGHSQRFFYPPLPLLVYLAARSIARFFDFVAARDPEGSRAPYAVVGAAGLVYGIGLFMPGFVQGGRDLTSAVTGGVFARVDMHKHALEQGPQRYWYGLDRFATLPSDAVFATTEVGMLSALNLKRTVVDLAGLNEPKFALSKFSAEKLFSTWHPDLIYMPHPHYAAMIDDIQKHPAFADYDVYTKPQLNALEFGIAIRKSSKYYQQMDAIVKDKRRK
ncbi:Hypothetical protein A7982_00651 [Minicystis rosea]|nr:Hypothetical protein A7982_00651 [Minicystis rosea]